jgi:hypothetical protein
MFSCAKFCKFHEPLVGSGLGFFLCIPYSFLMTLDFVSQSISPLRCGVNVEDGGPSLVGLQLTFRLLLLGPLNFWHFLLAKVL